MANNLRAKVIYTISSQYWRLRIIYFALCNYRYITLYTAEVIDIIHPERDDINDFGAV
jgi:hypothetical protein